MKYGSKNYMTRRLTTYTRITLLLHDIPDFSIPVALINLHVCCGPLKVISRNNGPDIFLHLFHRSFLH